MLKDPSKPQFGRSDAEVMGPEHIQAILDHQPEETTNILSTQLLAFLVGFLVSQTRRQGPEKSRNRTYANGLE